MNACPCALKPYEINSAMKVMPVDRARVKAFEPLKCIECGICSYVCPSKISLLDTIKRAKVIARLK